jgi:ribonucleoside-diphosphate reductase alpha chain
MDITVEELKDRIEKNEKLNIIDVREEHEFDEFNIGAQLIPLGEIADRLEEIEHLKEEEIILHCRSGARSGRAQQLDLKQATKIVNEENERVAKLLGINKAARTTTVKPSGTSSLALGTSSGIHAWHNDFYVRRIRVGKNEPIYTYLAINHPELIEDEYFRPHDTAVISVPQKAPAGSILRHESALDLLERVKFVYQNWVKPGHRTGQNTHNISATVSIKADQWEEVGTWMWDNRKFYNGLSVLPYDGGTYIQAPFEDCTEEKYEEMMKSLHNIDLSKVVELADNTNLMGEAACAGGACEIV